MIRYLLLLPLLFITGCSRTQQNYEYTPPIFGVTYEPATKSVVIHTPVQSSNKDKKQVILKEFPILNTEVNQTETKQLNPPSEQHTNTVSEQPTVIQKSFLEVIDTFLQSHIALLILFILLQWAHLLYVTKTGKQSETLRKAIAYLWSKMNFLTKLVYKCIRHKYHKKTQM